MVIEADPIRGLVWKPAAADTTRSVRDGLRRIASEPKVRCVEVRVESEHPDSPPAGEAAADALGSAHRAWLPQGGGKEGGAGFVDAHVVGRGVGSHSCPREA